MKAFVMGALLFAGAAAVAAPPSRPSSPRPAVHAPSSGGASQSPTPSLPVFEFKGVRAGEVVDTAALGLKCGKPDEDQQIICRGNDATVGGITNLLAPAFYLYNGRLSTMIFVFDGSNYSTIAGALTAKYGEPCSTSHPEWKSKAGATFENTVMTWCFASGKLEAAEMSSRRDNSHLMYIDSNQPPPKAPKVDF